MDPLTNTRERQVQLAAGLQRSFEQVAAFCAEQDSCPLGDDPVQATEAAQLPLQPLLENPIQTAGGRELTFPKATEGIIAALYSKFQWPRVIAGFAELREERGDELLSLRDEYLLRSEDSVYPNSFESTLPINCMDEERLTPEQATTLVEDLNEAAPFMDSGLEIEVDYGCSAWPGVPTLGFPYATGIDDLPQTLVVSVTGDGLTPHEGGVNLAEAMDVRLLTVDGEQHGATIHAARASTGLWPTI